MENAFYRRAAPKTPNVSQAWLLSGVVAPKVMGGVTESLNHWQALVTRELQEGTGLAAPAAMAPELEEEKGEAQKPEQEQAQAQEQEQDEEEEQVQEQEQEHEEGPAFCAEPEPEPSSQAPQPSTADDGEQVHELLLPSGWASSAELLPPQDDRPSVVLRITATTASGTAASAAQPVCPLDLDPMKIPIGSVGF
jgi:hypothetical protein